jgi:hypothetical protein
VAIAIIGSQALAYRIRPLGIPLGRKPEDIDIVGTYDDVVGYACGSYSELLQCYPINDGSKLIIATSRWGDEKLLFEAELAWPGSTAEALLDTIASDPGTLRVKGGSMIPTLDLLYMLKMSHRFARNSPHFRKTMADIRLLRKLGAVLRQEHMELMGMREVLAYGYPHPNLSVTKDRFFSGDQVNYAYDHDSVHEAMARRGRPAYTLFRRPGAEVAVSRDLFEALSAEMRLLSVVEEAEVLALERSQIPYRGTVDPRRSFEIALEKVCTSISSGWWREFAWENYEAAWELYDPTYADRFWAAVAAGRVRPFTGPGAGGTMTAT